MTRLTFKKLIDLTALPSDWTPVRIALDWTGLPLLLMVEGKPPHPDPEAISADPWVFTRWYQTPPKAYHLVHFDGSAVRTICFEQSNGLSTFHVQPFADGWLVGDRRGGRAALHDANGSLRTILDLGDASEDLQTTEEGRIWVSYFDEGVFGGDSERKDWSALMAGAYPSFNTGNLLRRPACRQSTIATR